MTDRPVEPEHAAHDAVRPPPCRPPLEIIETSGQWCLREYTHEPADATVFDEYRSRIDAMRAGQEKMETDRHPCLLRWDDDDVVGDLYWNELFDELHITRSSLLQQWVVVPADDHYVFASDEDIKAIAAAARTVQEQYDFKQLVVYDVDGTERDRYEHRFLRHDIAASGVTFDRTDETSTAPVSGDAAASLDEQPTDQETGSRIKTSTLLAAVPNLSQLQEISTAGPVLQYQAMWDGEQVARILLLDPEVADDEAPVQAFTTALERWQSMASHTSVTPILDTGPSPAIWLAYSAGRCALADQVASLSKDAALEIIDNVAQAVAAAIRQDIYQPAISPETIRIDAGGDTTKGSVAGWGVARDVETELGQRVVTPYMAPEELEETVTPTTPVYQLGAVAYRLLAGQPPHAEADDLSVAVSQQSPTRPSAISNLPSDVDDVFANALAANPRHRYRDPLAFSQQLAELL